MLRWLLSLLFVLAACDMTAPAPTPTVPVESAGQPREIQPLGDALNIDAQKQAFSPVIAVNSDGAPVVAWIESNQLWVKRWDGAAWAQMGDEALNIQSESLASQPAITTDANGGVIVAWRECCNPNGDLYAARWDGGGWVQLGGALDAFGDEVDTPRPSLVASTNGLFIAWRERAKDTGIQQLQVRSWSGSEWLPVGNLAILNANPSRAVQELALTTMADGAPAVVWVEWDGGSDRAVNAYRWKIDTATWELLPSPPEDSDDDFNAIGLDTAPDDTLYIGRDTLKGPMVQALAFNGASWTTIPFPDTLNPNQYSCIAAPAISVGVEQLIAMLWADSCNTSLFISQWSGSAWSTPQSLGSTRQFDFDDYAISSGADGAVYVTYLADAQQVAQVRVAIYGVGN